jgi:phospholipase C
MVIWFENKDYKAIVGSANAPYLNNTVKAQCGLATNYFALTHPSLPNYLAASDGFTDFIGRDCSPSPMCQSDRDNLYAQTNALGKQWRGYAEDMPSNCFKSSAGAYAARHNPALYYTNLTDCAARDVSSGTTTAGNLLTDVRAGGLPDVSFVVPNLCNDMHDCPVATGDAWLSTWIPVITSGQDYQLGSLAIFIVWDEGGGTGDVRSQVATFVLSAFTAPGTQSATPFDHYSLLRTREEILGAPTFLGGAATASSLRAAFNL